MESLSIAISNCIALHRMSSSVSSPTDDKRGRTTPSNNSAYYKILMINDIIITLFKLPRSTINDSEQGSVIDQGLQDELL